MNRQVIRWYIDLAMGIAFLFSAVTGIFKFTIIMRISGLTDIVLPMAMMSSIHDFAGIVMSSFVLIHLFLNRGWIGSMTRKVVFGKAG